MITIKRDGREKEFNLMHIQEAIFKALEETYPEEMTVALQGLAGSYSLQVNSVISSCYKDKVTVEEIQDVVEEVLKAEDVKLYKSYSDYRKRRTEVREKNSKKERFYEEVLNCSNIDNDNANVNQHSFSGRKYRIADFEQKQYALRNLISKEGRKAFEEGLIYYHDLSSYAIGEHNCLIANLDNGLKNGFKTRNGDVRTANSYSTACQLIAVIFQCQSQVQFGK
jgi:ribonucleoside-triphosphate reductase